MFEWLEDRRLLSVDAWKSIEFAAPSADISFQEMAIRSTLFAGDDRGEGEGTIAATPQYSIKHPPRIQLGNAPLPGFSGSDKDQIEILWETIPAGPGTQDSFVVEYRLVGQTNWSAAGSITRLDTGVQGRVIHTSRIKDLAYQAEYEYRVQHLRAGAVVKSYQSAFRTRLPAGSATPFSFATYGDSAYLPSINNFRAVQRTINQMAPQFSLLLGDNFYPDGTHPQSDTRFDPAVNPEAVEWVANHVDYLAIGNHETREFSTAKPSEELFSVPIPVAGQTSSTQPPSTERPEHNYSFDYGSVHFVTFDSNSEDDATRLNGQLTWVEQDLRASNAPWKIVFAHHPVAGTPDKTEGPSDNYYKQVVSRLRAAGADLFLVGHSHTYARTYPLLGQVSGEATYVFDSDHDYAKRIGLVQVVVGVGGAELREGDFTQFPFVAKGFSTTTSPPVQSGFVQVDVTASQLKFRYISETGQVVDTFMISDVTTNLAPIADPQAITASEDANKTITLTASDVNQDSLRYTIVTPPSHGTLTGTAPNLTYKAAANYNGNDSFQFIANDGLVNSAPASVAITVKPVNDRPTAKSFTVSTSANTPVTTLLPGSDVDGDPLKFVITSSPRSGVLTGAAPNLTYTPNSGFVGTDTFKYQVNDGKLSSSTATVTVKVAAGANVSTLSFQNGVFPNTAYSGTDDTKLRADLPTTIFGSSKVLELDGNPDMASIIKWNISQIPAGSVVRGVSITSNVISNSTNSFSVFEMLRPWKEAAATFNVFDVGQTWGVAGAVGSLDHGTPELGTFAALTTGAVTIALNSSGLAVVQKWINNPASNFGLIIQNYSNAATNDLKLTSSEGATPTLRPKLTIQYSPPATSATTAGIRTAAVLTNPINPYDVNQDGTVSSADALVIINKLNTDSSHGEEGVTSEDNDSAAAHCPDVSGDEVVSPLDVLLVVNFLNQMQEEDFEGAGEEEGIADTFDGLLLPEGLVRNDTVLKQSDSNISQRSDQRTRIRTLEASPQADSERFHDERALDARACEWKSNTRSPRIEELDLILSDDRAIDSLCRGRNL